MNRTKITAALLAALMLSSAFLPGCGKDEAETTSQEPQQTQTQPSADETEAETEPEEVVDTRRPPNLPEDLTFDGETLNVWHFTQWDDPDAERGIPITGDAEGDSVESAIFNRNLAVEDVLDMRFNFMDGGISSGKVGDAVRQTVMTADTTYDLFNVLQWNTSQLALEHCFMTLAGAPYLDLEQPWWSQKYIADMSIGKDNLYFLAGDVTLDMIRCISAMYFNKNLYTDLWGEPDNMYTEVLDGKWTIDRLKAMTEEAYADLNGDGVANDGDRWGLVTNNFNNIDAFTFGMGVVLTERDENNLPYLVVDTEHNFDAYARTWELVKQTTGALLDQQIVNNLAKFREGNALFLPGFLYTSENLREMTDDYGIIPFPKYDEAQAEYISCVHDIATLMCLPTTCAKVELACAALETMAYISYNEVTPLYYESALKVKYSRDQQSSQIIDMLHDASMTDLAYVYAGATNGVGMIMRNQVIIGNQNIASAYARSKEASTKALETLIENFNDVD